MNKFYFFRRVQATLLCLLAIVTMNVYGQDTIKIPPSSQIITGKTQSIDSENASITVNQKEYVFDIVNSNTINELLIFLQDGRRIGIDSLVPGLIAELHLTNIANPKPSIVGVVIKGPDALVEEIMAQ